VRGVPRAADRAGVGVAVVPGVGGALAGGRVAALFWVSGVGGRARPPTRVLAAGGGGWRVAPPTAAWADGRAPRGGRGVGVAWGARGPRRGAVASRALDACE